jgi:predicted phosphodiesterase
VHKYQQPSQRILTKPGMRILVPGDIHFGSADTDTVALMCRTAEATEVSVVVLQGDTFDAGGLSNHRKSAKRQTDGTLTVRREVEEARPYMQWLRDLSKGNCYIMGGNHEDRVNRLVDDNQALAGMGWADIYAAALVGWCVVPDGAFTQAGKVCIHHGHDLVGLKYGGGLSPAMTVLRNYPGQNTVFGHCHRRDSFTRPTWVKGQQVDHGAWCVGHLQSEAEVGWSGHNAWEQSFAIISYFDDDMFTVDLAQIRKTDDGPRAFIFGNEYR